MLHTATATIPTSYTLLVFPLQITELGPTLQWQCDISNLTLGEVTIGILENHVRLKNQN